jgi:glycosyltransferase involved in cell wall biosynthesis
MKKISYIPTSNYSKNIGYDLRNIILYSKLKKIKIHVFNYKRKYDYLILPPTFDISDLEWLKYRKEKIIFQLVDDYFSENYFNYKNYFRGLYKFLNRENKFIIFNYKKKLQEICKIAYYVICASEIQKYKISKYNEKVKIFFEGNFKDIESCKKNFKKKETFKIIWEGRCENIPALIEFYPAFKNLLNKEKIELHVISDFELSKISWITKYQSLSELKKIFKNEFSTNTTISVSKVFFHQWNISFLDTLINSADLAIIPLRKNFNFESGKGHNKLLMFMRHKIPVLTSENGAYKNIFKNINIDATCASTQEWINKVTRLINSEKLRKKFATKGFKYVNQYFSKKKFIEQWDNLFEL